MDPIEIPSELQAVLDDAAREAQTSVGLAQQAAQAAEQARTDAERKIACLEGAFHVALKLLKLNPNGYTIEYDEDTDKAIVRPREAAAVPSANSEDAASDQ